MADLASIAVGSFCLALAIYNALNERHGPAAFFAGLAAFNFGVAFIT